MASLLFDESMMRRLGRGVERLKKGARVISLRPILTTPTSEGGQLPGAANERKGSRHRRASPPSDASSPTLRLLHEGVFRMSWQMARVYIYIRS